MVSARSLIGEHPFRPFLFLRTIYFIGRTYFFVSSNLDLDSYLFIFRLSSYSAYFIYKDLRVDGRK